MITLVYLEGKKVKKVSTINEIKKVAKENYLWIDLFNISEQEKLSYRQDLNISLQLPKKKRIRHSFRFTENKGDLTINFHLLIKEDKVLVDKPVSFLLRDNYLVTNHNIKHLSFTKLYNENDHIDYTKIDGKLVFLKIIEKILEFDIDSLEDITSKIVSLSEKITVKGSLKDDLVFEIMSLQEELIHLRKNITEKQRVVSSIYKSDYFIKKHLQKHILIIEKDISSILEHLTFDFERLEYLQDTLMGLINLKQNIIMKLFTIVSVVFLPPTLIASIYGMNFVDMPELNVPHAYPIAIIMMLIVSMITLLIFKLKKWI
ncbi:MAG: magnesium and cobalt transport protein CorA [Flavobacteriaceae bacterium]|nr:magnesium and cobalt transport protein CorA [Flavobacteriaceae bacterium]